MVVVKLCILLVIAVGVFYVDMDWTLRWCDRSFKGVSAVFFAYMVLMLFHHHRRMQGSTAGFTAWYDVGDYHLYCSLYCVALVLTGMVNYSELNVEIL
jgi:hypothetical protein